MLFDLKSIIPETKAYPFMNEPTAMVDYITTKPATTYENLDWWIERTPEAVAIINAICTDIQADGFKFEGGKQNVNKAEHFAKLNSFNDEFFKVLWDWVKYGDSYLWIEGVRRHQEILEKFSKVGITEDDIDEDFPKGIRYIPTTTMNILHDGRKITKFKQSVSGQDPLDWNVKDIIHGALLPNKGKVYAFSPSWACLTEMSIISYLKDYSGNYFKNGGIPNWMFNLPNEMAGSPNHKKLIETLQKYKHPQRKHGNLVFAGEITATKLGAGLEDIDISANAIYFTSVLALAHNMPVSRVASIIGAKVKVSSGGDDLANEGYWSKIARHQDSWETWLNTQLWEPYFNVKIRFNRAWKTNEIKEQQRNSIAIATIKVMNDELSKRYGQQLTPEYVNRIMYLKDVDLEKGKIIKEEKAPMAQPDKLETQRGGATEKARDDKRKQAEVKGKITHDCTPDLFFEKFERWVKQSGTRDCYYIIRNGVVHATMSTPDENFKLVIAESALDELKIADLREFGKETDHFDL